MRVTRWSPHSLTSTVIPPGSGNTPNGESNPLAILVTRPVSRSTRDTSPDSNSVTSAERPDGSMATPVGPLSIGRWPIAARRILAVPRRAGVECPLNSRRARVPHVGRELHLLTGRDRRQRGAHGDARVGWRRRGGGGGPR